MPGDAQVPLALFEPGMKRDADDGIAVATEPVGLVYS